MAAPDVPLSKPKRIRYAPIIKKLMEERDRDGAIAMIVDHSGTKHGYQLCAFMKHVRERIAKDPKYLNPKCVHELLLIIKDPSTGAADRERLSKLLETPAKIRWMQLRRGALESVEIHKRLCEIRVFDPMYYDFFPTDEMNAEYAAHRAQLVKINHQHKHKSQDKYAYTEQEIDDMITRASEFCLRNDLDWTKRKNSLQLLECLCLLTGRRKRELCKTLHMRSSSQSDYQAIVWGICKDIASGDQERPIPLLAPIATIACGINKLRKYAHKHADYSQGRISRMFPKMSHTFFRNVYTDRAYRNRLVNQFHPESCSKLWWCSQALCDTLKTYCEHYATATIDDVLVQDQDHQSGESGSGESTDGDGFDNFVKTEMAD